VTGFSVAISWAVNQTLYPDAGELYIRGLAFNITVSGYGNVVVNSGLAQFTTSMVSGSW